MTAGPKHLVLVPGLACAGVASTSLSSCEACQKNRYGLIVVPRDATTDVQNVELVEAMGIKKAPRHLLPIRR